MDRNKVQEILDSADIKIYDELKILRYIDDLEEVIKEKDNIINRAKESIGLTNEDIELFDNYDVNGVELYKILNGDIYD